jgi:CBS domain-containing membrane protein
MPNQNAATTRSLPRTVAELMRRDVVTVSPSATVHELIDLLRENRISGVPVVEGEHQLVGTVSVSDLMWLSDWLMGGEPDLAADRERAARHLEERTVRDVMTPDIFGVQPDASLEQLAEYFSRTGLRRAIVVDRGRLVGIVSVVDLLGLIANRSGDGEEGEA